MSIQQDISLQKKVLFIGLLLMALKGVAYFITHSNAILSDFLESIVNISSGGFALYSLWFASRPSDTNHPYGHGKIEFVAGLVEGSLIVVAGLAIILKGGYNLVYPQVIHDLIWGIILTLVTGAVNFALGWKLKKQGQENNSMTLVSGGSHLMADGYTSLALLVGVFLVWLTGMIWADNVLAILFGLYILWVGGKIIRESLGGIMDETDMHLVAVIIKCLNKNRNVNWIDVHNLRVVKYGRDIHIDCHVTLPWYNSLQQSHDELHKIETLVNNKLKNEVEFFIHADPCVPASCKICNISNCAVRKFPFEKHVLWSEKNVLPNKKHTF